MTKISYGQLEHMLRDPTIPDAAIAPYLKADRDMSGPFDPRVVPDPEQVEMDAAAEFRVESAMRWANAICRWLRQRRFEQRLASGERLPVLVSEGDSWFQFPFLIDDVVDCLGTDHLIWSLDAAGDTAENMVRRNPEYLAGLRAQRANGVAAFLFSAAGNDVIGEDEFGEPVLKSLLKSFTPGKDAAWHVNQVQLGEVLLFLEGAYKEVVTTVRVEFPTLPILIHGYDYAVPGGHPGEWRNPGWADVDEWLGRPFADRGIADLGMQQDIVRILIDALYDMLHRVAGDATSNVHVVDVRGTLQRVQWADEIHGTSTCFAEVADLFRRKLREVGVSAAAV